MWRNRWLWLAVPVAIGLACDSDRLSGPSSKEPATGRATINESNPGQTLMDSVGAEPITATASASVELGVRQSISVQVATTIPYAWTTGDNGSSLIKVDLSTGGATRIGGFGYGGTYGVAFTPDGKLWATTLVGGFPALARVNQQTGQATIVAAMRDQNNNFLPRVYAIQAVFGRLYVVTSDGRGTLYAVDPSTARAIEIGSSGAPGVMDVALDPSGVLWAIDRYNRLWTIDPGTGAGVFRFSVAGASFMGIFFDSDGRLFATSYESASRLFRLNPSTGDADLLGALGNAYAHGGDVFYYPGAQEISFTSTPPDPALVGGTYNLAATGGASGNPVAFSSLTTIVCLVGVGPDGSTVFFVAEGTCTIAANQDGGPGYDPAPEQTQSFSIEAGSQSITFTSEPPSPALAGSTYALAATGGASGNDVTFSSLTTGACTVAGSEVSLIAVGTCTIAADQGAGSGYTAAPQVTQTFTVYGTQTVSFSSTPPSPAQFGGSYTPTASGGASGNAVVFTISTTSVCTIASGVVSFIGTGSCTIAANQAAGGNYLAAPEQTQTFTVTAATTSTTVSVTPATQQYSDKVILDATVTPPTISGSSVAGTVQFKIDGVNAGAPQTLSGTGTATLPDYALTQASGRHTVTAVFSSTNANFAGSTSAGVSLTVTKENASLSAVQLPGSGRPGDVTLIFSVSETNPDLAAGAVAAGDISLTSLSVTLVPLDNKGSAINLACDVGITSGTGYAGINTITCTGSGIPVKKYQVNGNVTGLYFTGVYSGEIKGSK